MPPTTPPISLSANPALKAAAGTVQPFIARNPVAFYTVVVFCSLSLACGAVYLCGAMLGVWTTTSVTDTLHSRVYKLWLKVSGRGDAGKVSSPSSANLPFIAHPHMTQHTRLYSPRTHAGPPAAANWAARHLSRCRDVDSYAVPIPTVQVGPPSGSATSRRLCSPTPPAAIPGYLVGLGLGTIPFTGPCDSYQHDDMKELEKVTLPNECSHKTGEMDITENSYSFYSEDDSRDEFSPYVPIYEDIKLDDTPVPTFVIKSPTLVPSSPAIGTDNGHSHSSLAYLKQETADDIPSHFALDIKQTLACHSVPDVRVVSLRAHVGKQGIIVLDQADKENAALPL